MTESVVTFLRTRYGFLCALAAVAGCLLAAVTFPILASLNASNDEIGDIVHRIAVYRSISARGPALKAELRSGIKESARIAAFLAAENPALAAAQLEMQIKTIVQANGGEIQSARVLPSSTANGLDTVSVQYDLSVGADHLRNLVYAIESHVPYFFIDDVSIHGTGGLGKSSSGTRFASLGIEWTVHGYRWARQR